MANQPAGTITFLFTDIEGSTRQWESSPDAMAAAVRRHDDILRTAIEAAHGYVFKTVGDAFCAAFAAAPDAIHASVEIQKRLRSEPWPPPTSIRVRIAIHSGEAELRDNDYFGQTLNRTARLQSLAYGGQTILSLVTEELVRDSLPEEAELAELGSHRLKDLTRPETVYELRFTNQVERFPPPKSLDMHAHNLPLEPTPLVGREHDLEALEGVLRDGKGRLMTLVGPGGIGKTRMSLQIAADLIEDFPDGAFVVDLSPIRQADQVPGAIAAALHVRETSEQPLADHLREWLSTRRILLILDNFEQVIEGGGFLATLLTTCAGLRMIVTSREPLRIRGERVYHIPPLGLPTNEMAATASLERLSQYDAVRLFIERATDVNPEFKITNENAPAIAQICVHLDGLPLALELAAARVSMLTPESLLKHLGRRLALLTGGARDLPTRQQTLRNTIDWSYELLSQSERSLFSGFAIFYGGFTVEAAEAVCSTLGFSLSEILEVTQSLVEKSLVVGLPLSDGDSRFYLLETIREYGREHLEKAAKLQDLARAHADYYLTFAELMGPELEGANPSQYLTKIDRDVENVRHAIRYFSNRGDLAATGRTLIALGRYWQQRGYLSEARIQLETIAASGDDVPAALLIRARCWAGLLAREQGDYLSAAALFEAALARARESCDPAGASLALHEAGWNSYRKQDTQSAAELFSECQKIAAEIGDALLLAKARFGSATVELLSGKREGVRERLEEARSFFHQGGHLRLETQALGNLGLLAYERERYDEAIEVWTRMLAIYEEVGDTTGLGLVVNNLGESCIRLGQPAKATVYFDRLDAIAQFTGNRRMQVLAKVGRAECLVALDKAEAAMESVAAALEILGKHAIEYGVEIGQCFRVQGDALAALGRTEEARSSCQRAVKLLEATAACDELARARAGLAALTREETETGYDA